MAMVAVAAVEATVGLTQDILRCIHDYLDIPDRRRMEKAVGWGVTGIHKLKPSPCDFVTHKNQFIETTTTYSSTVSFHNVVLPIPAAYHPHDDVSIQKGYKINLDYTFHQWCRSPEDDGTWYLAKRQFSYLNCQVLIWKIIPYDLWQPSDPNELMHIILMMHRDIPGSRTGEEEEKDKNSIFFQESYILVAKDDEEEDYKDDGSVVARYAGRTTAKEFGNAISMKRIPSSS